MNGAGDGRTGVLGGTFNPVHIGHLCAAEAAAEALGLERVLFVPCADPPHKSHANDDALAPAKARLGWLRAAVEDNPRFAVDSLEIDREGVSYSVDTLRALGERLAPARPVFLIGEDAFRLIGSWRQPREVFRLAHLAVMTRPPREPGRLADWIPEDARADLEPAPDGESARHREGTWLRRVAIPALDVSSSDIRARIREGRSVRYLLPEAVRQEVLASGAYARK